MIGQGKAIERKHHKGVAELLQVTRRTMVIAGQEVPVANLPYTMASDAAGLMAEEAPFAACYYDKAGARVFNLRSRSADGGDVSAIAKIYGGGGHRSAAGFQTAPGREGDDA
jgi:nanoRNase/pAp phosphatase (c-di-AMP/oligoRNAs hydrolase)